MAYDNLRYELRGHGAWITLTRADALNALNPATIAEIGQALSEAESDEQAHAVVITGEGRAFCAGADLKFINDIRAEPEIGAIRRFLETVLALMNRVESFPKPVIAAVNGFALAGGLELVLSCDMVVAAESAKLGDAHSNYGLLPGGGSSIRLPRKIGPNRAKYLLLTGESLPAAEWAAMGLVNRVVPDAELHDAAQAIVERLAAKSPLGLKRMKSLLNDGLDEPQEKGLRRELEAFEAHWHSADIKEGLAAFNEKRTPRYTGR